MYKLQWLFNNYMILGDMRLNSMVTIIVINILNNEFVNNVSQNKLTQVLMYTFFNEGFVSRCKNWNAIYTFVVSIRAQEEGEKICYATLQITEQKYMPGAKCSCILDML